VEVEPDRVDVDVDLVDDVAVVAVDVELDLVAVEAGLVEVEDAGADLADPEPDAATSRSGKARFRRGGQRKFCRLVAVMNRSSPLSSGSTPNWSCRSNDAAFTRITRKNSAVGTKAVNCSLGCLLPSGTSKLSKPVPSIRMWSGVPSAARDERCSAASWPMRCSPSKVAASD